MKVIENVGSFLVCSFFLNSKNVVLSRCQSLEVTCCHFVCRFSHVAKFLWFTPLLGVSLALAMLIFKVEVACLEVNVMEDHVCGNCFHQDTINGSIFKLVLKFGSLDWCCWH